MTTADPANDPFPKSVSAAAPTVLAGHELSAEEQTAYSAMFMDAPATLAANAAQGFPFSADALLAHCRWCMLRMFQFDDYSVLSSDFVFRGPVVGPVGAADLRAVFARFRLRDTLAVSHGTAHNLWVDPHNPARVFWVGVTDGVHTAALGPYKATGKRVRSPPQVASFTFDNDGMVTYLTAGYVLDRDVGNTGGLGALFGVMYAIGHPFPVPEGRPYVKSWQFRCLEMLDKVTQFFFAKKTDVKAIKECEDPAPDTSAE